MVTNNSTLTLDGYGANSVLEKNIAGSGSLIKTGPGSWTLSGSNTYKGLTQVNQGVLHVLGGLCGGGAVMVSSQASLSGSGVITGPVTVNGTFAPGVGATGSFTVANALSLAGTTTMRVSKIGATCLSSNVRGLKRLNCGGALVVTSAAAVTYAAGDIFTLFSSSNYAGAFASLTLPILPAGLKWNSSNLTINGTITVTMR